MRLGNNHHKETHATLDAQIREAERQLMERQHCAHLHTDTLVHDLQKEISSPTTLFLIGELGFIIGELTKSAGHATAVDAGGKAQSTVTPLKMALDFKDLALPLVWIMDTFHPEWKSKGYPADRTEKNPGQSI